MNFSSKQYDIDWRYSTAVTAGTTITIWTPTTSTRVKIIGFDIGNVSGASNTVLITFGNLAGRRIAQYALEASTTIYPRFPEGIGDGIYDRTVHAVAKVAPVDITVYGFEQE